MKSELTLKNVGQIANLYDLGKPIKIKLFTGGMISHNYMLTTDKGSFVVRKLGYQFTRYWRGQKNLEFKALEFLHSQDFPYTVPRFLKNKHGNYVSRLGRSLFEAYFYISGTHPKKLSAAHIKQVARAMALYHKCIKGFDFRIGSWYKFGDCHWVKRNYDKMKRVKSNEEVDVFMLKNLDFFISLIDELSKYDFNRHLILTHSDFSKANMLFNRGKLSAIIDFENLRFGPASSEIAYFLKFHYSSRKSFLNEYRKYNSLSKEEENWILPLIMMNICVSFWWHWAHMNKRRDMRLASLKKDVKYVKYFYKMWKTLK